MYSVTDNIVPGGLNDAELILFPISIYSIIDSVAFQSFMKWHALVKRIGKHIHMRYLMNIYTHSSFIFLFVDCRLRDGGMFNMIPLPVPYQLRLPACSCLSPIVPSSSDLYPIQSIGCLGGTSCRPRCTRFEDVHRRELVQSSDVTSMYSNIVSNNPFGRRRKRSASRDKVTDRTKRQSNSPSSESSLDPTSLLDFFNLFDLDIPVGLIDQTGSVGPSVQNTYFFLPDHKTSDLRPLKATWPTPSGISLEQAREFCFQTVGNTTLASACGESGLWTNMYIDDAVEMCLSDVQLTEDLTWASQTLPLVENQCEAAYVSNRTLWRPDHSAGNELGEVVPPEGVLRALNCPNECNGHGVCTKQGCICEDKYEPPDCSWKDGKEGEKSYKWPYQCCYRN